MKDEYNKRKSKVMLHQAFILVLSFTLIFGLIPPYSWQGTEAKTELSEVEGQAERYQILEASSVGIDISDIEELLSQELPEWEEVSYPTPNPKSKVLNRVQVLQEMPNLEPSLGIGGEYLSVQNTSKHVFSPVGQKETSVQFSWTDELQSWIEEQEGKPNSPPSGYPVSLYVRDVHTHETYLIRALSHNVTGVNSFSWDGRDSSGSEVPDGIYEWYLEADSVSVTFTIPAKSEDEVAKTETKTAPSYSPEYSLITLDRSAPQIIRIHHLGRGIGYEDIGIEIRDEVSGIAQVYQSITSREQQLEELPIHVIVPLRLSHTDERLQVKVIDAAGNEAELELPALPGFAHVGDQEFWPQATESIAGQAMTIHVLSGNGFMEFEGFHLPGIGPELSVSLVYNHQQRARGLLGWGWSLSVEQSMTLWSDGDISLAAGDGTVYWFVKEGEDYLTYVGGQRQAYPKLTRGEAAASGGTAVGFTLTEMDQSMRHFSEDGRILAQVDRYGNQVTYQYEEEAYPHRTGYRLIEIQNQSGRSLSLTYDEDSGRLKSIQEAGRKEGQPRQISFSYDDDGSFTRFRCTGKHNDI